MLFAPRDGEVRLKKSCLVYLKGLLVGETNDFYRLPRLVTFQKLLRFKVCKYVSIFIKKRKNGILEYLTQSPLILLRIEPDPSDIYWKSGEKRYFDIFVKFMPLFHGK